ncbi:putative lipoprotein [Janibacter sp. HTCC2649]|uniref:DUF305 domain-containing protein n=1 Tax=Janibacter sp. HTCC2649 TaxID=313589 RepID=UPI000067198A|nr:DUF305 domain-containing protein [Janibacter sp. HTCC2649]EAP98015.1 putative lipoprotein [Janibacter sp. HTCC2649]
MAFRPHPRHVATVAVVLALGLSGCSGGDEPLPAQTGPTASGPVIQPGNPGEPNATLTGTAAAPVRTPTTRPGDAKFYQDMIVHHAQAIVMVETVLPRLSDPQVKALADRMAAEQKPEILAMKTWLETNKQEVPPQATNPRLGDHDHGGMPGMASPAQLTALGKASGVEADRLFLTLMTAHHQGALTMVGEHGKAASDEFVSEMADDINVSQSKQIQQMQTMLARLS